MKQKMKILRGSKLIHVPLIRFFILKYLVLVPHKIMLDISDMINLYI